MKFFTNTDIWGEEYRKALKRKPKNTWVVNMLDKKELSVVHTSEPHGLISWGWFGRKKFHIATLGKFVHNETRREFKVIARSVCNLLNTKYPRGLPKGVYAEDGGE